MGLIVSDMNGRNDSGIGISYLARVDGNAVVLVLDGSTADVDTGGLADVETVGVVATVVITVGVVDGEVVQVDVGSLDTDGLDGSILDVDALEGRVLNVVDVHELGLGLATVGTLAVPPAGTVTVDDSAVGHGDGQILTTEADQGTLPFLVSEGSGALEGDLDGVSVIARVEDG